MTPDVATADIYVGGYNIDRKILTHIIDASKATGVDFQYMLAKAGQESSFAPTAKSRRSTATGLYQFTSQTWLELMKAHGAKYGHADLVKKIKRRRRGSGYTVRSRTARKVILNLRRDPRTSAMLAAEYAKSNQSILERALRRKIKPDDLYLAHFLGPAGAVKLLKAMKRSPSRSAVWLFPDAARSNPRIFYKKPGKTHRSVKEVHRFIRGLFHNAISKFTNLPPTVLAAIPQVLPRNKPSAPPPKPLVAPVAGTKEQKLIAPVPKFVLMKNRDTGINLDDEDFFSASSEVSAPYMEKLKQYQSAINLDDELASFADDIDRTSHVDEINRQRIERAKKHEQKMSALKRQKEELAKRRRDILKQMRKAAKQQPAKKPEKLKKVADNVQKVPVPARKPEVFKKAETPKKPKYIVTARFKASGVLNAPTGVNLDDIVIRAEPIVTAEYKIPEKFKQKQIAAKKAVEAKKKVLASIVSVPDKKDDQDLKTTVKPVKVAKAVIEKAKTQIKKKAEDTAESFKKTYQERLKSLAFAVSKNSTVQETPKAWPVSTVSKVSIIDVSHITAFEDSREAKPVYSGITTKDTVSIASFEADIPVKTENTIKMASVDIQAITYLETDITNNSYNYRVVNVPAIVTADTVLTTYSDNSYEADFTGLPEVKPASAAVAFAWPEKRHAAGNLETIKLEIGSFPETLPYMGKTISTVSEKLETRDLLKENTEEKSSKPDVSVVPLDLEVSY